MPCVSPLRAFYGPKGDSGKRKLVFKRVPGMLSESPVRIPCGQCVGCRLERSRQWAMRCLHESKMHRENSFLTLTYDADRLPVVGTLVKRDLQLFMKRLREFVYRVEGVKVRFFACGEYGDLNKRPHYHVLLFGYDFRDKRLVGQNGRGDKRYDSNTLRELWSMGNVDIGELNWDTCAYVARYVMKKVTGRDSDSFYTVYDADGVCHRRLTEFTCMSLRPGIGSSYYAKYGAEIRAHDNVIVNSRPVRPPKFYDARFDMVDAAGFAVLKRKRRRQAALLRSDNTTDRRRVKEVLLLRQAHDKKRNL